MEATAKLREAFAGWTFHIMDFSVLCMKRSLLTWRMILGLTVMLVMRLTPTFKWGIPLCLRVRGMG